MKQAQSKNASQKQNKKQRSDKEKKQDVKNAAFIAGMDQPNHPNT
ncbi:hypothetical protein [Anaerosinus massiliensis]|nr:hypothetical protein [Massilibacillus massiliensis]